MNKKLIYSGSILAVILIAAYFAYSYWTKTPEYSLAQITKSIQSHDVELFNKHVEVNTLASRLIDDMMSAATKKEETDEANAWSNLGQELGKGLLNLMKPRLTEIFKEQIEKYIETGDFGKTESEQTKEASLSLPELQKKFGKNFTGVKYSKKEGKIALVGIGLLNDRFEKELTLELKMREKEGGYWQLVEFANVPTLLNELQQLEQAKLDEINRPIREKMNLAISAVSIKKRSSSDSWGISRKVAVSILLKNASSVAVKSFVAELQFRDLNDKLMKAFKLSYERPIAANSTQSGYWELDINQFLSGENLVYQTPESQMKYTFTPVEVVLADGSELKTKTSLD
jgi:hypothetical protein